MIQNFFTILTHDTPIHHHHSSFHKITTSNTLLMGLSSVRIFPQAAVHTKKDIFIGVIVLHAAFQGKSKNTTFQHLIRSKNTEQPYYSISRLPCLPYPHELNRVQQFYRVYKHFHLLILSRLQASQKNRIPMNSTITSCHAITHHNIFMVAN